MLSVHVYECMRSGVRLRLSLKRQSVKQESTADVIAAFQGLYSVTARAAQVYAKSLSRDANDAILATRILSQNQVRRCCVFLRESCEVHADCGCNPHSSSTVYFGMKRGAVVRVWYWHPVVTAVLDIWPSYSRLPLLFYRVSGDQSCLQEKDKKEIWRKTASACCPASISLR